MNTRGPACKYAAQRCEKRFGGDGVVGVFEELDDIGAVRNPLGVKGGIIIEDVIPVDGHHEFAAIAPTDSPPPELEALPRGVGGPPGYLAAGFGGPRCAARPAVGHAKAPALGVERNGVGAAEGVAYF